MPPSGSVVGTSFVLCRNFGPNVAGVRYTDILTHGVRVCPGKDLALSMMWVAFATLLKTLDFSHPVDENGDVIPQKFEYSAGLI